MPHDESGEPPDAPSTAPPAATAAAVLIGRLNRAVGQEYEVTRLLGGGGMGFVFLARDRTLDRVVAVKAIRPELATEVAVSRFLREARILARIRHPNIIPVHHAGTADGLPFYVMDYVEGETLADRLRRGRLSERDAVTVGRALLDALAAAHAEGVVHRDVKPANVFLTGGRVLLGDFGVARVDTTDPDAASTSGNIGTPAYMAPEQATGGGVTEQTDLYAAGMVLYEMLTGRRWTPVADPATADWSGVPRRYRAPLRRALAWHPDRRWSRAAAFRRALSPRYRVARRVTLSGWLVASTLVLGAVLYLWWTQRAAREPGLLDLAIVPFDVVPPDPSGLGENIAMLIHHHVEIPQLRTTPRAFAARRPRAAQGPDGADRPWPCGVPARWCTQGSILRDGDSIEVQLRVLDEAGLPVYVMSAERGGIGELSRLSGAVASWLLGELVPQLPGTYRSAPLSDDPEALKRYLQGEDAFYRDAPDAAATHYRAALEMDSTFALARWRLVNVWRWQPGQTPDLQPHLLKLAEAGPGRLGMLDSMLVRAQLLPSGEARLNAYRAAADSFPAEPFSWMLLGEELFHRGPLAGHPFGEAADMLEAAVQLDPHFAPALELLAWLYIRMERNEEARARLDALGAMLGRRESGPPPYAQWLEQAWAERFGAQGALAQRMQLIAGPDWFDRMVFAMRMPFAFDMPDVEAEMGENAAVNASRLPLLHAGGHYGIALADALRGRSRRALAHLDSATSVMGTDAAALHAAEWRVLPPSVGVALFPAGERERGRAELLRLAERPGTARRAAWALALDAAASGDTAAARRWRRRLGGNPVDSVTFRLAGIVDARLLAARGRTESALARSDSLLVYDAHGKHGDAFARSVLHLLRASWFEQLNDFENVDRELIWAENLDIVGWPGGEPQAVEIDWLLSVHASERRAQLALDAGRTADACAHLARVIRFWGEADPEYGPRLDGARRRHAEHCAP